MVKIEVLRLENLSKFYTSESSVVVGLSGVTLSFSAGEFVALTGESGSGKSTLAHVLGGILPYESGEMYVYGHPTSHYDAYDWSKYRRDFISFISQNYGILPGNTVIENIESALRLSGLSVAEARERTEAILEEVELSEFKNRKAAKLSSGQKQRLSIARALAKPSKILIADEPTGNLDRENSEKIISLLQRAAADRLVILITHEFEEAKNAATRRIILSDGAVVTDARLPNPSPANSEKNDTAPVQTQKKEKSLAPYISWLTVKSRPVFTAILCLLLIVTMFITFVFVGNFMISLDDAPTRIYDDSAFFNGSQERIVVMRQDKEPLTESDYEKIMSARYVDYIERYGYSNDLVYHYKEGVDYRSVQHLVTLPGYHSIYAPDLYTLETVIEFVDEDYKFMSTLPYTGKDIIKDGRAATGAYEIVSADSELKIGDVVMVYLRDVPHWSKGSSFELKLTVVGTTDFGEGIYFSDKLAAAMSNPSTPYSAYEPYTPWNLKYIFLPYNPAAIPLADGYPDSYTITDSDYVISEKRDDAHRKNYSLPTNDGGRVFLKCAATHKATIYDLILVSEQTYQKIMPQGSNQISVYVSDYAYSERVAERLEKYGYIAVSPYKIGSAEIDNDLAAERIITLAVCAAAFVIAFVLQIILLRAMFASLAEYFRLMSNTGLTSRTAYLSLSLVLLFSTLAGEALCAVIIAVMNSASVERVVNIFKFLDTPAIILLFVLHMLTVALALAGILTKLKRSVFSKGKSRYDLDFSLMEEDA